MRIFLFTFLLSAILIGSSCGLLKRSEVPINTLVGQTVDVTFSHDCTVLWLSNHSYSNLVLVSVQGNRAVFRDPTNKFVAENKRQLDGVDRFNYGTETMNQMPRLLPDGSFSVRLDDVDNLSTNGRIVWHNHGRT